MKSAETIGILRRRFAIGGLSAGAALLAPGAVFGEGAQPVSSTADSAEPAAIEPGRNTSFHSLKQIDAGLLNVGYAEDGPADGPAVILLHGWPYDIYSFVDVAPLLSSAGFHVIVPYLRGYGTTSFLSSATMRNAQQSVVGLDIIALMDALKIQKATIAGFDWGARTADVMAVLWPERCKAIVSVSGYLISSPAGNHTPLPPQAAFAFWYQYYFATEVGKAGYTKYLDDFNKFIWHQASPKWNFDDATYNRTAASFNNPDQFLPHRYVMSHCLAAQEGDGLSIDLVYINNLSTQGTPLELRADPDDDFSSTLRIPSNSCNSRAHFIEIGFIVPELSQAHVGAGDSTTDRLTDFMSQGCC
jgi:pimeloyl-ACP methyl ester carboxylesterase